MWQYAVLRTLLYTLTLWIYVNGKEQFIADVFQLLKEKLVYRVFPWWNTFLSKTWNCIVQANKLPLFWLNLHVSYGKVGHKTQNIFWSPTSRLTFTMRRAMHTTTTPIIHHTRDQCQNWDHSYVQVWPKFAYVCLTSSSSSSNEDANSEIEQYCTSVEFSTYGGK